VVLLGSPKKEDERHPRVLDEVDPELNGGHGLLRPHRQVDVVHRPQSGAGLLAHLDEVGQ